MQINSIFVNFLAHDYLKLDNKKIADYCLRQQQISPGILVSNEGGWHSDYLNLTNLDSELAPLFAAIADALAQVQNSFGFNTTIDHVIDSAWININNKGHANRAHKHTGSLFSGVYYVKVPKDSGNIEFTNPIQDHPHEIQDWMLADYNAFTATSWNVEPEEGKLLIFPSWLLHYVYPSHSDESRISIAFNSSLRKK